MIIVLEGPDNAGKSTLAQFLAKELRAVYVKVERPKRAIDLEAYDQILHVANLYSGWVVTDRHVAISEPIYGTICRGGHDLRPKDIELTFNRIGALVYCRPPTANILGSIADRAQMEGVIENAEKIIRAYDEYFEGVHTDQEKLLFTYDYTKDDAARIVKALREYQSTYKL